MIVTVIGAGLAGVEAAWILAKGGINVRLYEARPKWCSPAHRSDQFAELVCSNSLRSNEGGSASALLKEEMRKLGSLVMEAADAMRLPAGKALAVDRDGFSKYITEKIFSHPNIKIIRKEVKSLPEVGTDQLATVIATGPLTSPSFTESLRSLLMDQLYFYDAIAPIVSAETIDMNIAFKASRYGVVGCEEGDYINCPLSENEYYLFVDGLLKAAKVQPHSFEDIKCFEGCQPIEIMAESHKDSLRHGPMKPVGIIDPRTGKRPFAVVQLRQDNLHATLYNIVGFQTRMTYLEQDRVFRFLPALSHAKFERYGSMHRNTFINGPLLLDDNLRLKSNNSIYVAGQLTGVEGYLESAATGLYVGTGIARKCIAPSPTTAIGALINHVVNSDPRRYQPMKAIWGIFPSLHEHPSTSHGPKSATRRQMMVDRGRADFKKWFKTLA